VDLHLHRVHFLVQESVEIFCSVECQKIADSNGMMANDEDKEIDCLEFGKLCNVFTARRYAIN